jgi:hypothetical protein
MQVMVNCIINSIIVLTAAGTAKWFGRHSALTGFLG